MPPACGVTPAPSKGFVAAGDLTATFWERMEMALAGLAVGDSLWSFRDWRLTQNASVLSGFRRADLLPST